MTEREARDLYVLSAGAAQGLIEALAPRFSTKLVLPFARRSVRWVQSARSFSRAIDATH